MEYDAARAADTRIVPVTDEDLRNFPEFGQWMNGTSGTEIWYNGARTAGDFIDCRNRFPAFWNISCRNISFAECTSPSQKSPTVFAYQGRYYFVSCYSGSGLSGHPGYPGPSQGSTPVCP